MLPTCSLLPLFTCLFSDWLDYFSEVYSTLQCEVSDVVPQGGAALHMYAHSHSGMTVVLAGLPLLPFSLSTPSCFNSTPSA